MRREEEPLAAAGTTTVSLCLVSHTNAGKTTLARTLLGRDVGEVRDEAHVTAESERQTLLRSGTGDELLLWDTPGFGDSARLVRRLRQSGNPIGWFLTEVWDRFRDRAFWHSQKALRTVVGEADVVLYLVNAAEAPEELPYLDDELQVLSLLERPVVALLNQLGPPRSPAEEDAELSRWRERLGGAGPVREVLALDAFARCWVQEGVLLSAVERSLPEPLRPAMRRLHDTWRVQREATWRTAMAVLAESLARAAADREPLADPGWGARLQQVGAKLGLQRGDAEQRLPPAQQAALAALGRRLQDDLRRATDRLIALHGLEGRAAEVVLKRVADQVSLTQPLDEKQMGLWSGLVTGAIAGLKADVLSGGLTMGGGLLVGSVLGALTGIGVARGVNRARGVEAAEASWQPQVLEELARTALLLYLGVAHYGRGRGAWTESEHPAFWRDTVAAVVDERREALADCWSEPDDRRPARLQAWLEAASAEVLGRLYPAVGWQPDAPSDPPHGRGAAAPAVAE